MAMAEQPEHINALLTVDRVVGLPPTLKAASMVLLVAQRSIDPKQIGCVCCVLLRARYASPYKHDIALHPTSMMQRCIAQA